MAQNFRKLVDGLNLVPKTTSTVNSAGDLDFDTTANKLNLHNGSVASPIVTESSSATLTNKTIAAGSNTISGLTNTNLNGSAAISNANLASMAAHSFKGNNTGSGSTPLDLTATQLTAELNTFTSSLQGLVSASGGGTTNFLRADGSWVSIPNPGVTSIGTIDSQTKSADGAVISSPTLVMQTADATHPGLMSINSQSFAGVKTFSNDILSSNSTQNIGSSSTPFDNIYGTRVFGATSVTAGSNTSSSAFLETSKTLPSGTSTVGSLSAANSLGIGNLGLFTQTDTASNASATGTLLIETGNKTAGTGNSGDLKLQTGTSSGGTRGTIHINPELRLDGSTSGYIGLKAAAVTTSYTIIMPVAQGSAGETLQNDGSGNLSWAAGGSGSGTYQTFSYTGIDQTFAIPAGVTYITVFGIGGGGGGGNNSGGGNGGSGGAGAPIIETIIPVTPSTNLTITIGAGGTAHTDGQNTIIKDYLSNVLITLPGGKAAVFTTAGVGMRGSLNGQNGGTGDGGGIGGGDYLLVIANGFTQDGNGGIRGPGTIANGGGGGGSIGAGGGASFVAGNGLLGGGGAGGSVGGTGIGGTGGDGQVTIYVP